MKFFRFQYIISLILTMLTACQDEILQPFLKGNGDNYELKQIFLSRGYSAYTLPFEKLDELVGCRVYTKGGFVFLSDSIVRANKPLIIEVEQNPYEEERLCELEFINSEGVVLQSVSLRQASSRSQTQGEAYSAALLRSYGVGYGYDAFGEYASCNSVRDQIISLPALRRYEQEYKTSCIVDDFAPDMETSILEGNNSEQLLKAFSAHAGLGLDIGFFQAHVEGKYSRSDLKTNAYAFCTIMNNYKAASRHVEPYTLVEIARNNPNILTEGFRHCVEKISRAIKADALNLAVEYTEELFHIYGTHLIYHADLGGKLEFCSTFERAALDSKTTLSIAAEASFLNMCGFKMEEGQTNTYTQTSTRQSRSISARGGDVAYIIEILNNEKDVLTSRLVNNWYKSIYLDFNDPKNSNVELIDFKLFPIYKFIDDVAAQQFVALQLGIEIEYENDMFPKVYDTIYAQIDLNSSTSFSDANNEVECLISGGNQSIIEVASEYIQINGKQYELRSLYPILAGEVRHEGIAVEKDSLYRILWKNMNCTLTPIGKRSKYSTLYYNDGDLDIIPDTTKTYSTNYKIETLSLHNWLYQYTTIYKYGPYMLLEGATIQRLGDAAECIRDRPEGWEVFTESETLKDLEELHKKYNIKDRNNGLKEGGVSYLIYNNASNQIYRMMKYHINTECTVLNPNPWCRLLYVRSPYHRY